MQSDPTAAAERLRDLFHIGCKVDWPNANNDVVDDLVQVATWALPLLDPTPIDEAYLRSVGFTDDGYEHTCLRLGPLSWNVWEGDDGWFYGDENIPAPKTRGELRMLVAGLKEGANA